MYEIGTVERQEDGIEIPLPFSCVTIQKGSTRYFVTEQHVSQHWSTMRGDAQVKNLREERSFYMKSKN
jgi:hypothetical protein